MDHAATNASIVKGLEEIKDEQVRQYLIRLGGLGKSISDIGKDLAVLQNTFGNLGQSIKDLEVLTKRHEGMLKTVYWGHMRLKEKGILENAGECSFYVNDRGGRDYIREWVPPPDVAYTRRILEDSVPITTLF